MGRESTKFYKLLELLSRSGSGILFPGSPGEVSGRFRDSIPGCSGEASCPGEPSGSSSVAGMSVEEWKALLWEAHRQRVMGLVADAVAALPYDEQPPLAIRAKLALELEVIEKKNTAVNVAARKLMAVFEAEGLHPVIQKGPAVAALYPNPLHREPGDIDLYFPADEFERSRVFVQKLSRDASLPGAQNSIPAGDCDAVSRDAAFRGAAPADACSSGSAPAFHSAVTNPVMESDGAFWYKYRGVTIEHHPVFYDCRCQFPSIDVNSPEAMLLMLSSHILKHALGKGIGLKQICDYFVARRSLNYDPVLLERLTATAGLRRWQRLLDSFGPALRRIVAAEGNFGSMPSSSSLAPGASLPTSSSSSARESQVPPTSLQSSRPMYRKSVTLAMRLRTAAAFCRKIPFALRYSPREWLHTVLLLSKRLR